MRKLNRFSRLWAILAASTSLAGCDALGLNQTREVAKSLLVRPDGKLDEGVASAVMNARFPSGTKFGDLQTFSQSFGGRCGQSQGRVWCDVPLHGFICDTRAMWLSVVMGPDDTIEHIEATETAMTC